MALDTFQTYKYHELLNKEYSLYKVSKDGTTLGITNSPFVNGAIEIIPFKYEDFLFFRTDRILAKFRNNYSGVCQKLNGELSYTEGNGDLYLFTREGECVLAGFSDILMEDENTLRVYFKNYIGETIYTHDWKTFVEYRKDLSYKEFVAYDELDSSYYILLNRDFKLKEIPDSYSSFRNSYLEMFDSNVNPFRVPKAILQRLSIHFLPVSLFFSHYDEEKETAKDTEFFDYEYNPSIDDSLDAFDGDVDAYNQWRL